MPVPLSLQVWCTQLDGHLFAGLVLCPPIQPSNTTTHHSHGSPSTHDRLLVAATHTGLVYVLSGTLGTQLSVIDTGAGAISAAPALLLSCHTPAGWCDGAVSSVADQRTSVAATISARAAAAADMPFTAASTTAAATAGVSRAATMTEATAVTCWRHGLSTGACVPAAGGDLTAHRMHDEAPRVRARYSAALAVLSCKGVVTLLELTSEERASPKLLLRSEETSLQQQQQQLLLQQLPRPSCSYASGAAVGSTHQPAMQHVEEKGGAVPNTGGLSAEQQGQAGTLSSGSGACDLDMHPTAECTLCEAFLLHKRQTVSAPGEMHNFLGRCLVVFQC